MRLSADQLRFVDRVANLTGLDAGVIAVWVGTVSGWGAERADHNYVGPPGASWRDTASAAHAAAATLGPGARMAAPLGPPQQIAAIAKSPFNVSEPALLDAWHLAGREQATAVAPARSTLWAQFRDRWMQWVL